MATIVREFSQDGVLCVHARAHWATDQLCRVKNRFVDRVVKGKSS
jgi:hypothetical protein